MSKLLLNLRRVPDDERDEICALLDQHGIAHYQTEPSVWGVSAGGIWLREDQDWERARPLLADYQRRRLEQQRAAFEQAHQRGEPTTVWRNLRARPLRALAFLVAAIAVLMLTIVPFVTLG